MKAQNLLDAFDRAEKDAREVFCHDDFVVILRRLKALTRQYIGHTKSPKKLQRPSAIPPLEVNSLTRWG